MEGVLLERGGRHGRHGLRLGGTLAPSASLRPEGISGAFLGDTFAKGWVMGWDRDRGDWLRDLRGSPGPRDQGLRRVTAVIALAVVAVPAIAAIAQPSAIAAPRTQGAPAGSRFGEVLPPDLEDVEHLCALEVGCDSARGTSPNVAPASRDLADCIRTHGRRLLSGAEPAGATACSLRATTCAELHACATEAEGRAQAACAGKGRDGAVSICDGPTRGLTCSQGRVVQITRCASPSTCSIVDGLPACAGAPCRATGAFRPRCGVDGARMTTCSKGRLLEIDCAARGGRCVELEGIAACTPNGEPCQPADARCDGEVAVQCVQGREVRVRCDAVGLSCARSGAEVGCAWRGVGKPCEVGARATCEGTSVRYCMDGRTRTYACRALGFTRCLSGADGVRCAADDKP
jgi:hypothetical protein